uniref:Uncharacterized protein n=1 Tax=Oryza rufipogon TaxID=4529 RepID=A0A0E0PME3_ORYRU
MEQRRAGARARGNRDRMGRRNKAERKTTTQSQRDTSHDRSHPSFRRRSFLPAPHHAIDVDVAYIHLMQHVVSLPMRGRMLVSPTDETGSDKQSNVTYGIHQSMPITLITTSAK